MATLLYRRRLMGACSGLVASAMSAPLIGRAAQGQVRDIRIFLPSPWYDLLLRPAFHALVRRIWVASGHTMSITPVPLSSQTGLERYTLRSVVADAFASGFVDGIFVNPSFFADSDPAFHLLGDALSSFDAPEQYDQWLRQEISTEVVRDLYRQVGQYVLTQSCSFELPLMSVRPLRRIEDFRGLIMREVAPALGSFPVYKVLRRIGVSFEGPRRVSRDALIEVSPQARFFVGGHESLFSAMPFYVSAGLATAVVMLSIQQSTWSQLLSGQRAILEQCVSEIYPHTKLLAGESETMTRTDLRRRSVVTIDWPSEERARLRSISNLIQEEVAAHNAMAQGVVDSIRIQQRRLGLI